MSREHEDLKIKLVKAVRMLEKIQLLDMNGHVSCRVPGTDTFLINCRKASRASLAVEDVTVCDMEGRPVGADLEPPSEVYIHSAIFKRRPDVASIIHGHPHYQTVLGIAGVEMKPVFGIGAFVEPAPMYEKASLVNIPEMGEELADVLGDNIYAQLRHHGNVVVGDSVESAFTRTVYLEENAKKQYYASLLGAGLRVIEGENLVRTRDTSWAAKHREKGMDVLRRESRKRRQSAGHFKKRSTSFIIKIMNWEGSNMLSQEQNDILTQVGPGTPMGNLFRRYWVPVGITS